MKILVIIAVFVLAVALLAGKSDQTTSSSAKPSSVAQVDSYITRMQRLQSVELSKFSWAKEGFGNVMVAAFTFQNKNDFAVKDIEITCEHYANSGTLIDRNVRTVFETVKAKGSKTIKQFNMGFVHSQASKSSCHVSNFSRG